MTSQFGLHQIIKEPTHIINNSFSCIDLIFCNQSNLIIDSGVHSSLHPCWHHQIVYAKVNLKIYYPCRRELFGIIIVQMQIISVGLLMLSIGKMRF